MTVLQATVSALFQVAALGGIPLLAYFVYHRRRHGRSLRDVLQRAGLQVGHVRYVWLGGALAIVTSAALAFWGPPTDLLAREGSALAAFAGPGITSETIARALLYGIVTTGFTEELLFRGLIGGSLARRLSTMWANAAQATVFLVPHLAVLGVAPEAWPLLPIVFLIAIVLGWMRIVSGSIVGPWIVHAGINVTTALIVAASTAT